MPPTFHNSFTAQASSNEPLGIRLVQGDGFLDHRVNARVQGDDAQRRMLKMRRGDDDSIHVAGFDERLAVDGSLQKLVTVERRDNITNRDEFTAENLLVRKIIS